MRTLLVYGLFVCCGCRPSEGALAPLPPPIDAAPLAAEVVGAVAGSRALVFPVVTITAPVVKPQTKRPVKFLDFETARCSETPSDSRMGAKVVRCSR